MRMLSETQYELVLKIARSVRRWALSLDLYDSDLAGACAVASYRIWSKLQEKGIKSYIYVSDLGVGKHAFVVCGNYVVDVTATQFGRKFKAVEFLSINKSQKHQHWAAVQDRLRSRNAIMKCFSMWPEDQHPVYFKDCLD